MANVVPFRGLLYSTSRIPDLAAVVAPPYDVISPAKAEELRSRSPHNIVHLDLPAAAGPERYAGAASLLARWRDEGVLVRDEKPAVYVMSQRYAVRGMPEKTRWGFLALLRIEDEAAGIVLPHEKTMDAPRLDRLELSAATRTQLSPIFVVYADPEGVVGGAVEAFGHRPADRWVSDDAGVETKLWRSSDPEVIRALCGGLATHRIWIADGHHRYAAARELRDRLRATEAAGAAIGDLPCDHVLSYFSNVEAPGLTILPYHRVIRGVEGFDPRALIAKLGAHFDVKSFVFEGFDHRAEQIRRRLHEVSERGRLAIALYAGRAEFWLLLLKTEDGGRILDDVAEPLRTLDVTVLHRGILEMALGITPDEQRGGRRLRYTEEVERAMEWVNAGEGQAAFLLNPPRRQVMMAVAEAGLQMPQKSTFFYPKVPTGLVLHPLDP